MKSNLTFGEKIKYFRKRANISQLVLETEIGAACGSLSRIEHGIVNPTKETLFQIARVLKLNSYETAYLFGIFIENISETSVEVSRGLKG